MWFLNNLCPLSIWQLSLKLECICWTGKSDTNAFQRSTDTQLLNELPTDEGHFNVPQDRLLCPTHVDNKIKQVFKIFFLNVLHNTTRTLIAWQILLIIGTLVDLYEMECHTEKSYLLKILFVRSTRAPTGLSSLNMHIDQVMPNLFSVLHEIIYLMHGLWHPQCWRVTDEMLIVSCLVQWPLFFLRPFIIHNLHVSYNLSVS